MPPAIPVLRLLATLAAAGAVVALAATSGAGRDHRRVTPAPGGPWIWVSNAGAGDVAVIDGGTDEVVARIPVGPRPRGLRADRSGRVYVAVSATPGPGGGAATPAARTAADAARAGDAIAVLDASARRVVHTVPRGRDPDTFDVTGGGAVLVVSSDVTGNATLVDVAGARVAAAPPAGEPAAVAARPGGKLVAVASERADRVDLVDVAGHTVARVPTCRRPRSVAFTPDGALAFVSCEAGAAVGVIDARALRAAGQIPLPPGSRPTGLALAPDGRTLYVANGWAGTVSAVDVARRVVTATSAPVGARIRGIAPTPDGRLLYAADGPGGAVAVLDTATLRFLRRIPTGASPWGVAVVP